ncbi:MAG: TIGR03118 family protein [Candidatus Binatus sp.]
MRLSKRFVSVLGSALVVAAMAGYACAAGYTQTNLVTNGGDPAVTATFTDPNLVNPWGISFFPGITPFWVSDNNAGVATLYDGLGDIVPLVVEILSPADNPNVEPDMNTGTPTGQVANLTLFTATPAFPISTFGPADFIFATEDGQIEAWNTSIVDPDGDSAPPNTDDAVVVVNNSTGTPGGGAAGAVYKGLALATRTVGTSAGVPFLYATNFRTGNIDVFDGTFSAATVPGAFKDPNVQAGYAPFGIQTINNNLWVTYALQDAAKHDPVNKPAHGFVSVFDTDGNLLSHFAQHGHLSSPWGVGLAPASFGKFGNDILVGNFGDGQINAFDPANGHWLGMLSDASGKPIINPGLWSVTFSGPAGQTATNAEPDTLYITAGLVGPTHENAGLFAKISPNP